MIIHSRQNRHDHRALPVENLSPRPRRDMCPPHSHLRLHDLLLLHEEVADAAQNDALSMRQHGSKIPREHNARRWLGVSEIETEGGAKRNDAET